MSCAGRSPAGPGSVRQQCAAEAGPAAAWVRTRRLHTQARAAARTGLDDSGVLTGGTSAVGAADAAAQRTRGRGGGAGNERG